jgi:hypothetical protein
MNSSSPFRGAGRALAAIKEAPMAKVRLSAWPPGSESGWPEKESNFPTWATSDMYSARRNLTSRVILMASVPRRRVAATVRAPSTTMADRAVENPYLHFIMSEMWGGLGGYREARISLSALMATITFVHSLLSEIKRNY